MFPHTLSHSVRSLCVRSLWLKVCRNVWKCVSADSDEFPVLQASDSDGEEDNERSERRLGCSHTHTHTLTHTPILPKNNIYPSSLTPIPRIIAFTADAFTKGEAGCRPAASEPFSLSGGEFALKNLLKLDAPCGDNY
jgi:hypothetical protein